MNKNVQRPKMNVVTDRALFWKRTVEHLPEGPCDFEPLHLRQASGFAGYAEVVITGIMRTW
jgi:hypothetical protein